MKKIAFVAMPFKTKETGLDPGKGPTEVDFDALWDEAFYPALDALGYRPIRADNQDGSVIVKDMLEQLVFADLVLADISIPNGNVYYETGVRHAAREKGCILISANWARPLFDLAQLRQMRYTLTSNSPGTEQYQEIQQELASGLPKLANGKGPVFSLISLEHIKKMDSSHLRENADSLAKFQTKIRNCRLETDARAVELTRKIVERYSGKKLPMYATRELVELVRDKLGWQDVLNLLKTFKLKIDSDPLLLEQKALALRYTDAPNRAIAELETLIKKQGVTSERLGLIGGCYKTLFRSETDPVKQQRYLALAIEKYREGMMLNLNEHRCSSNLPALLCIQNRDNLEEARQIGQQVKRVCERLIILDEGGQWLKPTQLLMAYFFEELETARELVQQVFTSDMASWELSSTLDDLKMITELIEEGIRSDFESLTDVLIGLVSIPQKDLIKLLMPDLVSNDMHFKKFKSIKARNAVAGEKIVSYTSDGRETEKVARQGEYVVENQTSANELYIVSKEKFEQRYRLKTDLDGTWSEYDPLGEVKAVKVDNELMILLNQKGSFHIYAGWGSPQRVERDDYLVAPLPNPKEIYRIGRQEFEETYQKVETRKN